MRFTMLAITTKALLANCILISSFISFPDQLLAQSEQNFKVDPEIEQLVESKVSDLGYENFGDDIMLFYDTEVITNYYENDSLIVSTQGEKRMMLFRSFYYSIGDTLSIDGLYGMFGGIGFSVKIIDNEAKVFHLLTGDEFPEYSLTEEGELEFRIEVPCTNTNLILSKVPIQKEGEVIYGMVEFSSGEYFHGISQFDGKEVEERKRVRSDMKIYFKSKYIDIERIK